MTLKGWFWLVFAVGVFIATCYFGSGGYDDSAEKPEILDERPKIYW